MSDLIRRTDAIKAVWGDDINPSEDGMVFEAQSHIDRDIRLIPSADRPSTVDLSSVYSTAYKSGYEKGKADRPQGEWLDVWQDGICSWRGTCSVCRSTNDIPPPFEANFCPSCGARMKGADDDKA